MSIKWAIADPTIHKQPFYYIPISYIIDHQNNIIIRAFFPHNSNQARWPGIHILVSYKCNIIRMD